MNASNLACRPGIGGRGNLFVCAAAILLSSTAAHVQATEAGTDFRYLAVVRTFADNVLEHGRDTYGKRHTPLFVDGINVDTHEPPMWKLPRECAEAWGMPRQWVMTDMACQQVLFRVLDLLSKLTGDIKYRQAAIDSFRYHFEHLQHVDGLLFWGGHAMIDAVTERPVGEGYKDWRRKIAMPGFWDVGVQHELKHHYPCYDLMWETDPHATRRFIEGFWSAHVLRWDNLDFNRHGIYGPDKGCPWNQEFTDTPMPFETKGLTLLDGACDMMHAAVQLYLFTGDRRPLVWAKRLAKRYADIRDPRTGLGPDVFGDYRKNLYLEQFGPEFGDRFTETSQVAIYGIRYSFAPICQLLLADQLGAEGEEFKRYAVEDLTALARHLYDEQDNRMWCMLTDGTKLAPDVVKREGMFTAGDFNKRALGPMQMWSYAIAYRLTKNRLMWDMARNIARANGLGDIGEPAGEGRSLNLRTALSSANAIFALIELARLTGDRNFLQTAQTIGDTLVRQQFDRGFFVPGKEYVMSQFDTTTPLALLHLEIALQRLPVEPPPYFGNASFFMCPYEGQGRMYSGTLFGAKRRNPPALSTSN